MAVLVEGISVVARRDAVVARLMGGLSTFLALVPNKTHCSDGTLDRVGFLSPTDARNFVDRLENLGLVFQHEGVFKDIAIVDQLAGPTLKAPWLEFARVPWSESTGKVSMCWLFEGPRITAGIHLPSTSLALAVPEGWEFEESLSAKFKFFPNSQMGEAGDA